MGDIKYDSVTNEFFHLLNGEDNKVVLLPQIIWHITDRCYLNCPYCFATKTGKETEVGKLNEILELYKILGVQKVDIAGGDPMTYSNLNVICENLYNNGFAQTITTSGVGKKELIDWLIENGNMFSRIIISVDGSTPEEHNLLRGKGVYEKLLFLINQLKEKQYNNLRINTVITQHFLKAENCEKIVHLIKEINPVEWCLIQTHPANKKEEYDKHAINNETFENIVSLIKNHAENEFIRKIQITERRANNYAKYWVLYPDGKLRQHSESSNDQYNFDFSRDNLNEIIDAIEDSGVWVPFKNA